MKQYPLFKVFMSDEAVRNATEVLTSGYVGQGPKVEEFETALKEYTQSDRDIITLNSATSGLELACQMIGIKPGDEVISTPITCTATQTGIILYGGMIVWGEVDRKTGLLDPDDVKRKITDRTKAIVATNWGGRKPDYNKLKSYGIPVIEDAAHGPYVLDGNNGDYVVWSTQAIKFLTTGDGGFFYCPDPERARLLRWYGLDRRSSNDFRCLHPSTKVQLVGQKAKRISEIVNNRVEGSVYSVDANGNLVERRIINWYKNARNGRSFYKIKNLKTGYTATVTEDHKVLTLEGWKQAMDLTSSDLIATGYPDLSLIQKQILLGCLLGDGYLAMKDKDQSRAVLQESHTSADREYTVLKAGAFKGLRTNVIDVAPNREYKLPNGKTMYYTHSLACLADWRKLFYPNGKKILPRQTVEKYFSPLSVAIWYMDDGSTDVINSRRGIIPKCQIATNGFTEDEVKWLAELFTAKGFDCAARYNHGWRLMFSTDGSYNLVRYIAPYIPDTMRYKVAHLQEYPFDITLWGDGSSPVLYDYCSVERIDNDPNQSVYCLEVEGDEHNFATVGGIVHNCAQNIQEMGRKLHMNDIAAAIGLGNLPYLDDIISKHKRNAALYEQLLTIDKPPYDSNCPYWIYTVFGGKELIEYLKQFDIAASPVHARNDTHYAFRKQSKYCDNSSVVEYDRKQCNIPVGWYLDEVDIRYIAEKVNEFRT